MTFRIVPGPYATPVTVARAVRRPTLEAAVADMGEGMVLDHQSRVVAFHEKHLRVLEAGSGNFRV